MIHAVIESAELTWLDVVDPSAEELRSIAERFQLASQTVEDCLDPTHLPKFEALEGATFLVVRYADPDAYSGEETDTVHELTRKISIFYSEKFILSIHRKDHAFHGAIRDSIRKVKSTDLKSEKILLAILSGAVGTYETPLHWAEDVFDSFEAHVFASTIGKGALEKIYFLKRKLSVFRRMNRQTINVMKQIGWSKGFAHKAMHAAEQGEKRQFFFDELVEDLANLLAVQFSLASHRANEIMRVLTLFSVFFMPLTFIVGVYGMNFQHMPELPWVYGYPMVWAVMLFVVVGIFLWFRRKGWLT